MAKIKQPIKNYYKNHVIPPLAKIFYPTSDEFADPFSYVDSIREEGRNYGVIKIIPPSDFKPPFSLARTLEFKPRSQRLSMTDAFNREHYLISDKLKIFYIHDEIKGKPPKFGGELLNLAIFLLAIDSYEVRKDPNNMDLWKTVALLCNIEERFATALKLYYYSIISPFRVALRTEQQLRRRARTGRHASKKYKLTQRSKRNKNRKSKKHRIHSWKVATVKAASPENKIELPDVDVEEPQPGPSSIMKVTKPQSSENTEYPFKPINFCYNHEGITRKRSNSSEDNEESEPNIKRIKSMIPTPPQIITDDSSPSDGYQTSSPAEKEKSPSENVPEKTKEEPKIRRSSRRATAEAVKKIASFNQIKKVPDIHQTKPMRQRKPKRTSIPEAAAAPIQKLRQFLPTVKAPKKVVAPKKRQRNSQTPKRQRLNSMKLKPELVKMFFEAPDRFSLQKFREHADAFKAEFFHAKKASDVTVEEVEKVFWKNVGDLHSDLFAFYGADLNSGNFGSGFPLRAKTDEEYKAMSPDLQYYSEHPWNLNNLPIAQQSAFYHLEENISGMTIPWVYVGMCFSLFCWHVEDHWTYSINYMHEGETKVWYGIPEKHASKFDCLMRQTAPELFEEHPDLLHHMSTMAHPKFLMDNDIDVYTVRQNVGEIVITFPRAYHAGFNAGYNVAEAVNFAPYDWLRFGRLSLQNYAEVGRACVFSHDSLVLSMANDFGELDPTMLKPVIEEYTSMINRDLGFRKYLKKCNFNFNNPAINLLDIAPSDDLRSCIHCNTLLYSAAVICPHMKVTCPLHFKKICKECKLEDLRFAYSNDPISLYNDLKEFITVSDPWLTWINLVQRTVKNLAAHKSRIAYEDLVKIKEVGEKAKFPLTKDIEDLDLVMSNYEEFAAEVQSYLPTWEEKDVDSSSTVATSCENRTYFPPLRDNKSITLQVVKQRVEKYPVYSMHLEKIIEHYVLKANGGKDRCQKNIEEIRNSQEDPKILLAKAKILAQEFEDWPIDDPTVVEVTNEVNRIEWLLRVEVLKKVQFLSDYEKTNKIRDEAIKAGCKLKVKEFTTWTLEELQDTINEGEKFALNCSKVREALKWLKQLYFEAVECEKATEQFLKENQTQGKGYEAALKFTEKYVDKFTWLDADNYNKYIFMNESCLRMSKDAANYINNMTLYSISPLKTFCTRFKKNILLKNSWLHQIFMEGIQKVEKLHTNLLAHFRLKIPYYRVHDIILGRYDLPDLFKNGKYRLPYVPESLEEFEFMPFQNNKTSLITYIQNNYDHSRKYLYELYKINSNPESHPKKSLCVCGMTMPKENSSPLSTIRCIICATELHISCAPWNPFFNRLDSIKPGVYMCPRCIRSKRPYLNDLKDLIDEDMNDSVDFVAFKTFFNVHKNGFEKFLSLPYSNLSSDDFRKEANVILSSEIMDDQVYRIILNHPIYDSYFTPEQLICCRIVNRLNQARETCSFIRPYLFEATRLRRRPTSAIKDTTISKKLAIFDVDDVECKAGKDACIHPLGKSIAIKCTENGCNNFYHFTCISWNLKLAETCCDNNNFKCHKCSAI